jgi:hypothetical protein
MKGRPLIEKLINGSPYFYTNDVKKAPGKQMNVRKAFDICPGE